MLSRTDGHPVGCNLVLLGRVQYVHRVVAGLLLAGEVAPGADLGSFTFGVSHLADALGVAEGVG